jgi:hypothetical protein
MRQAGDRVHIVAGTYFDCLNFDGAQGTAANPIAFVGEGDVRIVCTNGEAVSGNGVAYIVIQHLQVLASAMDANAIHIDGNSNHILITQCEVAGVGAGGDCIKVNQTDDVQILDNDVHNADNSMGSAQGIDLVAVHRALIRGNHVHDIADSQGIFAKGGASDIVIERNLVERITSNMSDAIGIVLGGVTDRPYFIPTNAEYEATRTMARNNVIIGADGAGIGAQGCHDCTIVGNTLWNCGRQGYAIQLGQGATGMDAGGDGTSVCVDIRVIDNLVGNPYGTMRAPIQAEAPHRAGLSLGYNWWWNGPSNDVFDPGYNADVGVTEPHSHSDEDPQVIDPDQFDLHLEPSSPARGAGEPMMELAEDFDGMCRATPPDIGAY